MNKIMMMMMMMMMMIIIIIIIIIIMNKLYFTGEVTLHIAQTVNTEQLQHCVPCKHGSFQVYTCKYPA